MVSPVGAGGRLLAGVLAAAAATIVPSAAANAQGPRAKVDAVFSTQSPGASAGRTEYGDFVDPANPGGKPHAAKSVVLELASGARWDTDAIPQCTASDAELMVAGPAACPADTKVGQGPVVVDTGFEGSNRNLDIDFTAFNEDDGMILVGREKQSGGYLAVHGSISGGRLEIQFPPVPGTPPDGGALKTERIVFFERSEVRGGERHAYLTTPPSCPPSGTWVNKLTYTYADGVSQTVESVSPCVSAAQPGTLRLRLGGLPGRGSCVSRAFSVRVKLTGSATGRRAWIFVDGRRIAKRTDSSFEHAIDVAGLRSGRHRLTVKAKGANGERATRRVRFSRC